MPRDWVKSRIVLLRELRRLRKERDALARRFAELPGERPSDRFEALYRAVAALSAAGSLEAATAAVVGDLAARGGWGAGMVWLVQEPEGLLCFAGSWHAEGVDMKELASLSRQATFLPGQGPLGHAWGNVKHSGQFDLKLDGRSPRALYAVQAGLNWAVYHPIWHQDQLLGFFEFFGSQANPPEEEFARLVEASGWLLAQRVMRERAEASSSLADPEAEVAVIELDASGRVVRWGKDAERLKGFTADEVLGRHFSVFYPEAEEERAEENLTSAAARGFSRNDGWRVHKDAGRFWAKVLIVPKRAPHGELTGYTKVVRGLTSKTDPS